MLARRDNTWGWTTLCEYIKTFPPCYKLMIVRSKCGVGPWLHPEFHRTVSGFLNADTCTGLISPMVSAAANVPNEAVIVDDADPQLIWSDGWDPVLVSIAATCRAIRIYGSPLFAIVVFTAVGNIFPRLFAPHTNPWVVCYPEVQRHSRLVLLRYESNSRHSQHHS